MYLIDLCSTTGDSEVVDSLETPVITVRGWSKRINAPGKLVFSIHRNHPAATDENLRMWRHVRLYRKPRDGTATKASVWYGLIISKRQLGDHIEVLCHGALRIFDKRYTDQEATFSGQASTEALGLLSATNLNDGDTGIAEGDGGVTTTVSLILDAITLSRAFEELAMASGAEYEVDDDALFNFVPSLGSDKSATIELIFRTNGDPGTNVIDFEVAEDGEPMANKIIGTTSGGLSSTYEHPTSSDTYPVLVERKAFNSADDQTTLDSLVESYGLQRSFPIPDFQAVPATATKKFNAISGTREIAGLQYEDVQVGDLVLVTIITPNRNESVVKRIAEVIVDVDENLNERLRFTLTEAAIFVTERYLDETAFGDIKQRIQQIEYLL